MFGKTYRLPFSLLGIPVLLDISFLIILPLLAWLIGMNVAAYAKLFGLEVRPGQLTEGATPYWLGFIAAVGLFVSVIVHELGHAVLAQWYGIQVKSITLWFLGGVAQFDEMPKQRGGEAIVAVVGPVVSLAIAAICWGVLRLIPPEAAAMRFVFHYLTYMNVVLAVFNMLPALPLDGGRVLRSLLELRMSHLQATQAAAGISKFLAILLGFWGIMTINLLLIAVAFFIYMAVSAETQQSMIGEMLRGISVRDLMSTNVITVRADMPVSELISKMIHEHHLGFPVVNDSGQLVGMASLKNMSGTDPETPIEKIMSSEVNTIQEDATAMDAFMMMSKNNFQRLVVLGKDQQMSGIITKMDLMRAIQIRMAAIGAGNGMQGGSDPLEPILHEGRDHG